MVQIAQVPTRPIIRYYGGKWKLAPWIISHFPRHKVYVEPFGGAGSVLLSKPRSHAEIYNDADGEIVNLFRVARDQGEDLIRSLELTPFAREEFDLAWEQSEDPLEKARRTVIRAYMGRDPASATMQGKSSFRVYVGSKTRQTTTMQEWANFPSALNIIISRLRGVAIENMSAFDVMSAYDSDDALHYLDPPYVFSTRTETSKYRHEMDDADHIDLIGFARKLKGMVIISGYDCELYREILGGWRKIERKSFADGAEERVETLWMSPNFPSGGLFD